MDKKEALLIVVSYDLKKSIQSLSIENIQNSTIAS